MNLANSRVSTKQLIVYLIVLVLGIVYVAYNWVSEARYQRNHTLQLANTVAASLNLEELVQLHDPALKIDEMKFPVLKGILHEIVQATPNARFAYLYVERNDKVYFLVDSEPETSADYSPAGQKFDEAAEIDKLPFKTKQAQITDPVTDRWGTWVSAEVPLINPKSGMVDAIFGMDYNANSWILHIIFNKIQAIVFVLVIFSLVIMIYRGEKNNRRLKEEIEHRVETEVRLMESRASLGNLVSNLPGFIYQCALDNDYTMRYISDACSRITGYQSEDFVKIKKISFNDLILPEYRESIWAEWQKVLADGSVFEYEYPIKAASGEIKWLWERGRCVFDEKHRLKHLEGYIEDISDRKKAEAELKKLSLAIEQSPVSVVGTNAEGVIQYVNPMCTEMTGYQSAEALGSTPRILKSGKMSKEFYQNLWETINAGKIWKGEFINKNKQNELYWASKLISPIVDENNVISGFIGVGQDVTNKKKTESELIQAKEKAEESDRLKSAFLANISHEIRTPMNGIMGFAELLKEPDLSEENRIEYLEIIERSGQRMLNIINDLIDISKIEAGQMMLTIKRTNLNKVLLDLHQFFLPECRHKKLEMDLYCDLPDVESYLDTDATKFYQVLSNLIKNAIKYTEKGSVKFGYKKRGEIVEFFVSDTGSGIPGDQTNLIFERFRQSNLNNLTRKFEGAGLGLAISKAYIEMLGGKIWVMTELGKGSTFYFDLPLTTSVG